MESLAQRTRLRGVCAACRSIFLFRNDRSTLSFDPEALDGRNSTGSIQQL
jgi:hypothetical protein